MKIQIILGDITKQEVDVIVNAANSSLLGGGGVDGAIHQEGGKDILAECKKIGYCPTGQAVMTTAGNLKAKKIIHAVGPIWQGGKKEEKKQLTKCYHNTLKLAEKHQFTSIAFPNISTGIYGFPKKLAVGIVTQVLQNYFFQTLKKILLVCFDEENYQIYQGKNKP